VDIPTFCREIETYLCRKNDGHLIRVTGPSFVLVSQWAAQGVPLKVAFAGIDRYFERYYRQGPRRRPVKIDFCEADVRDAFDEWRRATGVRTVITSSTGANRDHASADSAAVSGEDASRREGGPSPEDDNGSATTAPKRPGLSLRAHLERVLLRLTAARAGDALGEAFDTLIDRVAAELDAVRAPGGNRGEARRAVIDRLSALDRELLDRVRALLADDASATIAREADEELAPFRATMATDAFAKARDAAIGRLVRERFGLPTVAYEQV
jgi:hypothetical protein